MTKASDSTADDDGEPNRRRPHLREISADASSPSATVAQELRAARLRRGDDLASVSRTLKIRKDHLEAIEEDKFEALPGRTYAIGFVRSYSEYLGLDPVQAVERFKDETAGRSDGTHQIALVPDTEERRLPHGWIIMAAVVAAIIGYAIYHLAISADTLLRQPVAPVPARIEPPRPPVAMFNRPAATHPAQLAAARPVAADRPSISAGSQSWGTSQTKQQQNLAKAPAATSPGAGAPSQASPAVTPNQQLADLPKGQEFGLQNKDARIILRAKTLTRVLVQGPDGTVFINRILHPGDSYRVPDRVGLTLTTPDGGAVALELDGQEVGFAGKDGQVTEALPLDPQAIEDRSSGGGPG
jgi:cytoskeleton protein RodZ